MFRHNPDHGHCIRPDRERAVHVKNYGCIVCRLRGIHHCKIIYRAGFFHCIIGERNVRRCQRLLVRKLHIIPDRHRPGQAVLAHVVTCRKVIADRQIRICHSQCALDQGLVHMFSCAPAIGGIEPGFRLGIGIQRNHYRVLPLFSGSFLRARAVRSASSRTVSISSIPAPRQQGAHKSCG